MDAKPFEPMVEEPADESSGFTEQNYCRADPTHIKTEPDDTSEVLVDSTVGKEKEPPPLIKIVLEEINPEEETELGLNFDTVPAIEDRNYSGETAREKLYYNKNDPDYEPDGYDIKHKNKNDSDPEDNEKAKKIKKKLKPANEIKNKPKTTKRISEKTPTSYQCDLCGLCFNNNSCAFNYHMISKHTDERPFLCDKCPRRFKFKNKMNEHIRRVHIGGHKKFTCEICNKTISGYLGTHMKIHLGIKDYKCELCEKSFVKEDTLKRHMLVHTGETPYACTFCDRKFSQNGNLRTHMRTHTLEKPFVCVTCGESFSHNVCLKTHVQKYHDKKEEMEKGPGEKKKGCSQREKGGE